MNVAIPLSNKIIWEHKDELWGFDSSCFKQSFMWYNWHCKFILWAMVRSAITIDTNSTIVAFGSFVSVVKCDYGINRYIHTSKVYACSRSLNLILQSRIRTRPCVQYFESNLYDKYIKHLYHSTIFNTRIMFSSSFRYIMLFHYTQTCSYHYNILQ